MSVGFLLFSRLPALAVHTAQKLAGKKTPNKTGSYPTVNILVLRLDNLGDVVMSTPIFREIKLHYPEAKLTVVVQDRCRQVIETNPFVDKVLGIKLVAQVPLLVNFLTLLSTIKFYLQYLRAIDFDIVLHPRVGSDGMNESLLIALISAPLSIGYGDDPSTWLGNSGRNRILKHVLQRPEPQNEVLSNAAIVSALTQAKFSPKTEVFLRDDDLVYAAQKFAPFPPDHLVITLGFGAMIGRRRWPSSNWTETLNMLAGKYRISVLILAVQADSEDAEHIRSALQANAKILVGASIREVAACISKSNMFIGVDSGLAHIAAAVNVPAVIVSPHPKNGDPAHYNSPIRFAPFGEKVIVVTPSLAMPPCSLYCDMKSAHCILQITPEEVVEACAEILDKSLFSQGSYISLE